MSAFLFLILFVYFVLNFVVLVYFTYDEMVRRYMYKRPLEQKAIMAIVFLPAWASKAFKAVVNSIVR